MYSTPNYYITCTAIVTAVQNMNMNNKNLLITNALPTHGCTPPPPIQYTVCVL